MSVLEKLTEGIVSRDLKKEGDALLSKWEKTGLLEGLEGDSTRQGMARLLENQAAQLLKEASTMAGGNVEGFASVAFPLVRRVFGGLLANDVVSVQPMSLPSGLIFFLDFTHNKQSLGRDAGDSVYGGGKVGQAITGGVNLGYEGARAINAAGTITDADIDVGFYNLSNGYSSPTGSVTVEDEHWDAYAPGGGTGTALIDLNAPSENAKKVLRYDPDVLGLGDGHSAYIIMTELSQFENLSSNGMYLNKRNLIAISASLGSGETIIEAGSATQVRRLTALGSANHHPAEAAWDGTETQLYLTWIGVDAAFGSTVVGDAADAVSHDVVLHFPLADNFAGTATADDGAGNTVGVVTAASEWGLELSLIHI